MNTLIIVLLSCAISTQATPWYYIEKDIFETFYENLEQNDAEPDIVRLPENIAPVSYDLRVVPNLKDFTFSGKVGITIKVSTATKVIVLNSKNLEITEISLYKGLRQIEVTHEINKENELLTITASTELEFNTNFILTIRFAGKINEYSSGLFKSWYIEDGKKKWLAATNLKATHAREVFPCFDEPKFRAPMMIYISHYEQQSALSNMQVDSTTAPDSEYDNRVWDKFEKTPPIPTHLVAIAVSEFRQVAEDTKKINVVVRPKATSYANYASKQAKKLLQTMETFTGVPYSMPKFDVFAIPDLKSGLAESWGLTAYKEGYVLLNEDLSSDLQKRICTQFIARGLAHQWFGGFVTPAWWGYNWLDEGFATYFEYFLLQDVESSWKTGDAFIVEVLQQSLNSESSSPRAMTSAVTKPSQIPDRPNSIDSLKAASVLRMMEHIVTPKNFKAALKNYLVEGEKTRNGIVVPANLYESFDDTLLSNPVPLPEKTTITSIFKPWTENIGYPLITVARDSAAPQKVKIVQTTYKSKRAEKTPPDQEWVVPITYTTKSDPKFGNTQPTAWSLSKDATELPTTIPISDWILVNLQQTAYCRVNYDPINWELLTNELNANHKIIHVTNRAQLIDDSFAMAADKIIPYTIPMKMAMYLAKEQEILPWEAALSHWEILSSKFKNTEYAKTLKTYAKKIMQEAYESLGFEIKPTDSFPMKSEKSVILQFFISLDNRIKEKALEKYKTNEKNFMKVEPNIRKLVFCTALQYGENPEEVYNNLWSTYLSIDNSYDKNEILSILACTGNKDLMEKTILKLFTPGDDIPKQDQNTIIRTTLDSTNGVDVILKILNDKISKIDETPILNSMMLNVGKHITTDSELKQLEELITKCSTLDQKKYGKLTASLQNTHATAKKQLATLNEDGTALNTAFDAIGYKPTGDDGSKTKPNKDEPTKPSSSPTLGPSSWMLSLTVGYLVYKLSFLRFVL